MKRIGIVSIGVLFLIGLSSHAAGYPAPKEGSWVAKDFRFHTGEVLPELRLHYTTVGASTGAPVLVLHGTTGAGINMLTPAFAGERNPPELGIVEREIKRVRNGRYYLIPASEQTAGHGTTGMAKFWKLQLEELLQRAPRN